MKGYSRYSQAYKKAAVSTVDQKKLIVMMYDGAIKFLTMAIDKIDKQETYEAHRNLIRGKSIIAELLGSLDLEHGGDIGHNLQRLYTYMFNELIEANLNNDVKRISSVIDLLKELRVGWQGIQNGAQEPEAAPAKEPATSQGRKSINVVY